MEPMNNQNQTKTSGAANLPLHYIEMLDAIANIAKGSGHYGTFVNALLTVTAIILGELPDEAKAQETLAMLGQRQQVYREQHRARVAAALSNPTVVQ
jgi:hypothetical protein